MSAIFLIAVNLAPLYGVFFLGWQADNVLILYWLESAVIGVFTAIKALRSEVFHAFLKAKARGQTDVYIENVEGIVTFLFIYGVFWFIHGSFLLMLLGSDTPIHRLGLDYYKWNLIAIGLGQLISFKLDFLDNAEYTEEPEYIKKISVRRIIVLQTILIFGRFWNNSIFLLALLILLKTFVDLINQIMDRRVARSTIIKQGLRERVLLSRSDLKK